MHRGHTLVPVSLAFVCGFVDTMSFVGLFHLFAAHVTGNLVVIAAELTRDDPDILTKVLVLPVYALAVAVAVAAFRRLRARGIDPLRPALLLVAALLLACLAAGAALEPLSGPGAADTLLVGCLAVTAMAVQNTARRDVLHYHVPLTVMTGNLTQLIIDAVDGSRRRAARLAAIVAAFVAGGAAGAVGVHTVGFACLALPVAVLLSLAGSGACAPRPEDAAA